ncbi:HAMP domain-containing histidine kinase [Nostoc sp. FACHB-973]|uniref:HAMP domain-containing histidine kinase n=2 Tax=Nostocaceae TaxID=1162 RepID=A0A8J7D1Y7_DESMC|nr:HAMP domain-containing histidine kinase [Desmonostoc muscorum]MBD2518545.1 HAMP domain-containing histidine kinase [Nostoc sp. FACHB-973]
MAIAYQIVVEKHAGSIEVDSTPGRETEFTIRIPLTSKK